MTLPDPSGTTQVQDVFVVISPVELIFVFGDENFALPCFNRKMEAEDKDIIESTNQEIERIIKNNLHINEIDRVLSNLKRLNDIKKNIRKWSC